MTKIEGFEVGGTSLMEVQHAKLLQDGKRRMPRENETCDNSCFFAFACQNFNDRSICKGFLICSNGRLDAHVRRNCLEANEETLSESDRTGIQSYVRMYQRTDSPEIKKHLVPVILRYLRPPITPTERKPKFRTMVGFQEIEISEDNKLSLPQTKTPKVEIPPPIPLCLLELHKNTISKNKEKKPI